MTDLSRPPPAAGHARIGDAMPRVEDERLLRGRAVFIDDIDPGPGTLHAVFVRSPQAHAVVKAVSVEAARTQPGVAAVYTGADFAGRIKPICADFDHPGFKVSQREAMATDRVRFVGDTLAMVLADDPYRALDAAEWVGVELDPLPAVADVAAAVLPNAPRLHAALPDNVLFEGAFASEGFDTAHAAAPFRLAGHFEASRQAAVSIEPRGCIAKFDVASGMLTLWSSTQVPHLVLTALAEHLSLRESDIRVVVPEVGGGFGMKTVVYPEELLVAAAAMECRAPVKWVQDRLDDFLTSAHARDHRYDLEVGFDGEGTLLSVRADVLVNVGAYASLPFGSSLEANGAPRNMPGPYTLRNFRYRTRAVATNTCPTGAYRGVSAPLACMALESMIDRIARQLGKDPADVRRRNLVTAFPYRNVLGLEYGDGCFVPALDRALHIAEYAELRARQRGHDGSDGTLYGIGVSVTTEQTGMGAARYKARGLFRIPGFESAAVKIEPDGSVVARVSLAAQGQGHLTAFTQIVSDELGVPVADIRVIEGDTALTPTGTGTFASRGIAIAGVAVVRACEELRGKMTRIARRLLDCDAAHVRFVDGRACVDGRPDLGIGMREIAAAAYSKGSGMTGDAGGYGLEATVYQDPPNVVLASTVHVVSVAVEARTGRVAIDRYAVIHDCGRMVNPMMVDGQVQGAVVQGIGEVLMEAMHYDAAAQPSTASLMEYQLPRSVDVVPMRIEAMHSDDGARVFKGVGESGIIGAVPALASAIADALAPLGIETGSLPLTSQAVRRLIRQAAARGRE